MFHFGVMLCSRAKWPLFKYSYSQSHCRNFRQEPVGDGYVLDVSMDSHMNRGGHYTKHNSLLMTRCIRSRPNKSVAQFVHVAVLKSKYVKRSKITCRKTNKPLSMRNISNAWIMSAIPLNGSRVFLKYLPLPRFRLRMKNLWVTVCVSELSNEMKIINLMRL